ncbi:hypothetical protein JLT2_64 [Paraglaciecola Antarctic JLT virus 2]|nr:hypothetical protein JLT2_64 [Paraglaciecola Antarctic JLT virus 2]
MKNADMPAMPLDRELTKLLEQDCIGDTGLGLTKREHFAGLAPEMPSWFIEGRSLYAKELYFAWRTYYADELLKELDK